MAYILQYACMLPVCCFESVMSTKPRTILLKVRFGVLLFDGSKDIMSQVNLRGKQINCTITASYLAVMFSLICSQSGKLHTT